MNSAGPSIERSTWLSAARFITHVGLILIEQTPHCRAVADIGLLEAIAGVASGLGKGIETSRIGQLVDIHHEGMGIAEQMPDDSRADKAGAASDKNDVVFESA